MIKQLSPFCLGIEKEYVKNPLFTGPTSMVPSDSIDLTSEAIMFSCDFGTFTSHLKVGFTGEGFWLNYNRCPCVVPNTKGSWVILIYSCVNSLSVTPKGIKLPPFTGSWKQSFWILIWSWKAIFLAASAYHQSSLLA